MKKIKEIRETATRYQCPYCGYDFGFIEDAGYYFERTYGTDCPECGNDFDVSHLP